MYRFIVTEKIEEIADLFAKDLFSKRRSDFVQPIQALIGLYDQIEVVEKGLSPKEKKDALQNFKDYIKNLAIVFDRVVNMRPKEYDWYQEHFFSMVKSTQFSYMCKNKKSGKKDSFYMLIVEDCLRYSAAREEFISCVKEMNIQSCVYCNMHSLESCLSFSENFATYQLDHYKDKRDYPFLGINFFNMVPSCSFCNQKKSKNLVPFYLYRLKSTDSENPFRFKFLDGLAAYFIEQKRENINFEFDIDSWYSYQHESIFRIQARYKERVDEIENFLKDLLTYNPEYMELRKKSFPQLPREVIPVERINRLLKDKLDYNQIHEYSYAKIRLDLAEELNLTPCQTYKPQSMGMVSDLLYGYFLKTGIVEKVLSKKRK